MRQRSGETFDDYPLVHRWLIAPGIRLEGDALRHGGFGRDPRKWKWAERPSARLLWDFSQLAKAPNEEIEKYAKKWGCLALCPHGIPAGIWFGFHTERQKISPLKGCEATGREPLLFWRQHAQMFGELSQQIDQCRTDF